ncbi:MAG: SURF1 family protein, partial [Salinibacterium sp.]|nr:SURF1 family protein [Salinibacterium sp.]
PRELSQVLPSLNEFDEDDTWTPVVITGRYLVEEQVLVRGRPFNGLPGFEQLVPLQLADGRVFIIDRGWLQVGNAQDTPDVVPLPPSGEVTVIARLKPGEPIVPGRSAPEGQLATIHLPQLDEQLGLLTYTGAYGLLDSEDPASAALPAAAVRPVADECPHLSYAFQWLIFGVMAFIGLAWAIRQEYRFRNEDDPEEQARAAERARRKAAKPRSDSEVEDELLDAR